MKYIHLELSNLIGRFERTMVQIYIYTVACRCGFSIIQVKESKFTKTFRSREPKVKRRFKQHKWIKLMQY